mgnify:CR=1 FL=1
MNTNFEFLILGGYGQFVWPAFIFAFVSCFFLYLKTKKELTKHEQRFLSEFKQLPVTKIKSVRCKENLEEVREALPGNPSL